MKPQEIVEKLQSDAPNVLAHLPQEGTEDFEKMCSVVQAYFTAYLPAGHLSWTSFIRGLVYAIERRLFKFRGWKQDSVASVEFAKLTDDSKAPLPFDPEPEATEDVVAGVAAVFTNF